MKQAFNPYLPSYEYVPDGEPHVFEGRLYIFGSHDGFGHEDFCLNDYVTWSAPLDNLADWRYEGVIYRRTQDPKNRKGKSHMNAPDVCRGPDGRYYLYYQLHDRTFTSVAVADRPQGPYEFYGYVHHKNGKLYGQVRGDSYNFDPGLLTDDDGRIYFYTGFAPNAAFPKVFQLMMQLSGAAFMGGCCAELEPDMLTLKDGVTHVLIPGEEAAVGTSFEGHGFFEASSPRKINGTYYLVYSSALSHELCYATAERPLGPFRFGGTIISIGDVGLDGIQGVEDARNYTGNTHGGLVEVQGQWYIFYHRQTNLRKCNRQGCAEKVTILPDGSIPQVELTSCGLNPGPLEARGTYEARIACNLWDREPSFGYDAYMKGSYDTHPYLTQSGEDREERPDQYIANLRDGATGGYKYFDFAARRPVGIAVRLRGKADGILRVSMQEKGGEPAAELPVHTADASAWQTFRGAFQSPDCVSALYFTWLGTGSVEFDCFSFEDA